MFSDCKSGCVDFGIIRLKHSKIERFFDENGCAYVKICLQVAFTYLESSFYIFLFKLLVYGYIERWEKVFLKLANGMLIWNKLWLFDEENKSFEIRDKIQRQAIRLSNFHFVM